MNKFTLSVPASSANLGPGFDSAGLALKLYLTLQVAESDKWEFDHQSHLLPSYTHYENHFIYRVAKRIADRYNKQLTPCKVVMESEIPLARGLGSSASAVVAGIELANQVCGLSLSNEEKLRYGTDMEGHPDNVTAALFGGFVITVKTPENDLEYVQLSNLDLDTIVYIPSFELKTEAARKVLPSNFSREQAITASSISNVLIAALLSGDYTLSGRMMERDLFHEPYRAELIPHYHDIKLEAKKYGAYGTVISGAGPTMISFVPHGKGNLIAKQMQKLFPDYQIDALSIDQNGIQVKHMKTATD